jgi:murein DD-endopeptidase MepM/ murein hydrolase activator NlpD
MPGETLLFNWPKAVSQLSIDHKPLSILQNNFALGVISHQIGPSSYLVGVYAIQAGHAFRSPQQNIFIHQFDVRLPIAKKPSQLRLPAAVLKKLSAHDDELRANDSQTMRLILSQQHGELTHECWQRPLHSKIVSLFSSPRILSDGRQYYHSGLDLRAQKGTPIPAASAGTIAFADHMVVPGNMVVVDHGGGVFSRYMHLSKIEVSVGESIARGQILGLSGATGRAEAPHLHWEIVWKEIPADPLRYLAAMDMICGQE